MHNTNAKLSMRLVFLFIALIMNSGLAMATICTGYENGCGSTNLGASCSSCTSGTGTCIYMGQGIYGCKCSGGCFGETDSAVKPAAKID